MTSDNDRIPLSGIIAAFIRVVSLWVFIFQERTYEPEVENG